MKHDVFIQTGSTIKQALKKLDECREKVLLVINESKVLQGTLTDGDIRRALLKGTQLEHTISGLYNEKPQYVLSGEWNMDSVRRILLEKQIELIPVLDNRHQVVDYINWKQAFSEQEETPAREKIDIPVIIMAGGKGTRMAPFTNVLPKPLIPIGEKTILEMIIDEFRFFGMEDFFLTLNYKGEMIEAYFKSLKPVYRLQYLWEKEFLGTAGSLNLAEDAIKGDFLVSNCDVIVKADYAEVLRLHRNSQAALTIVSSIQHYTIPYGVVRFGEGGVVQEITEKPEYTFPINTGVYILSRRCFELIPSDRFYNMTDLIGDLLQKGEKVLTYPVNENDYIDIGQWEEYRSALQKMRILD